MSLTRVLHYSPAVDRSPPSSSSVSLSVNGEVPGGGDGDVTSEQSGWVSHSSRRSSRDASSGQLSPDTDREQTNTIIRVVRGAGRVGAGAAPGAVGRGVDAGRREAAGPGASEVSGELLRARLKELVRVQVARVAPVHGSPLLPLPDVAPEHAGRAVPDLVAKNVPEQFQFPFPDLVSSNSPLLPPAWFANPSSEDPPTPAPGSVSPPSPAPCSAPIAVAEPAFEDEELQVPPPSMFCDDPPPPEPFRDDAPESPSPIPNLADIPPPSPPPSSAMLTKRPSLPAVLAKMSPSRSSPALAVEVTSPVHNGTIVSKLTTGGTPTPPRSQSQRVSPSMGIRAKLTASASGSLSVDHGSSPASSSLLLRRLSPRPAVRQTAKVAPGSRPVPAKRHKFPPPLCLDGSLDGSADNLGDGYHTLPTAARDRPAQARGTCIDKRPWRRPIPITSGLDPPSPAPANNHHHQHTPASRHKAK